MLARKNRAKSMLGNDNASRGRAAAEPAADERAEAAVEQRDDDGLGHQRLGHLRISQSVQPSQSALPDRAALHLLVCSEFRLWITRNIPKERSLVGLSTPYKQGAGDMRKR